MFDRRVSAYFGDSTQLLYLRARQYSPNTGRFLTEDTWGGDSNLPVTYNKWIYANANPIMYADPSGHCFFGIDTAFCIAVLVGVPAIAGVTTASWDYYVTQGHGVGGENEFNPNCVDWEQVFGAGRYGSFGAIEPFAMMPASVILTPSYLFGYFRYGMTPGEVNELFINQVGLSNAHNLAMQNPYYIAGRDGGSIGSFALSLHLTLSGLPTISTSSGAQLSGYNTLVLSGANITAVGGDISLIYTGTSGLASSGLVMMSSSGGGGGPNHTYEEYHDEYEKTVNRLKHSLFTIKVYEREINRATDLATIETLEDEILLAQRDAMIWHQFATKISQQAIADGFNASTWSPLSPLPWLQ